MTSTLPVSVVIATRDRPRLLRGTVDSILAGRSLPAEIVVADQSRGEVEPLPGREPVAITHLRLATSGLSRGRNAGIAAAREAVLAFTDDDVLVEPDWLERLVAPLLEGPGRFARTGAVLAPPGPVEGHVPSLTYRDEPCSFTGRPFADPLSPNNMALPRAAFDEVGRFDERLGAGSEFPGAEDNDLGYRLLEAGWRIEFDPAAIVYHLGVRRGRELLRLDWAYGRGQGAFYAKHMAGSGGYMRRRLARNVRFRLRRLARIARGDRRALGEAVYLAGLASGALAWRRRHGRGERPAPAG